jgi:hypothetical protein
MARVEFAGLASWTAGLSYPSPWKPRLRSADQIVQLLCAPKRGRDRAEVLDDAASGVVQRQPAAVLGGRQLPGELIPLKHEKAEHGFADRISSTSEFGTRLLTLAQPPRTSLNRL